jgi:hypothetical protein
MNHIHIFSISPTTYFSPVVFESALQTSFTCRHLSNFPSTLSLWLLVTKSDSPRFPLHGWLQIIPLINCCDHGSTQPDKASPLVDSPFSLTENYLWWIKIFPISTGFSLSHFGFLGRLDFGRFNLVDLPCLQIDL